MISKSSGDNYCSYNDTIFEDKGQRTNARKAIPNALTVAVNRHNTCTFQSVPFDARNNELH